MLCLCLGFRVLVSWTSQYKALTDNDLLFSNISWPGRAAARSQDVARKLSYMVNPFALGAEPPDEISSACTNLLSISCVLCIFLQCFSGGLVELCLINKYTLIILQKGAFVTEKLPNVCCLFCWYRHEWDQCEISVCRNKRCCLSTPSSEWLFSKPLADFSLMI